MRTTGLYRYVVAISFSLVGFFVFTNFAEASCGNIVIPENFYEGGSDEEVVPIEDCDNPFNVDTTVGFTYSVGFEGSAIEDGAQVFIGATTTSIVGRLEYAYVNAFGSAYLSVFKKEGDDYRRVLIASPGYFTWDTVAEGEYVGVVAFEFAPVLNNRGVFEIFYAWVLPQALAYYQDYEEVQQFSFTIERLPPPPPEPTGASSVLFLPGVLGSRLFEESDVCGGDGSQQERWPSRNDCEQLRLKTNFLGDSVNDIYTLAGEAGILDEAYSQNIYKSFMDDLESWKNDGDIADFALVPYDWRLSIADVLKSKRDASTNRLAIDRSIPLTESYLYKELEQLAESSLSGKVTFVAHSNGGLVAKQFIKELQIANDPLIEKIDNLILVAVPQVGTPDAVWALLHGTSLGPWGFVLSNETSRQLLNTMAMAHHLLPNQNYFSSVSTPVISFVEGELTNEWLQEYGEIKDRETLFEFIDKNSGRIKPEVDDLLTPEIVDPFLLNYAEQMEMIQGNWNPPSGLNVYQIAGTGLDTPSGLTYFTDRECVERSLTQFLQCTGYAPKLGYRVNRVIDGDQTVVVPSALVMGGDNIDRWWLNIKKYNDDGFANSNKNRKHSDFFEIDELSDFIINSLKNVEGAGYQYLSQSSFDFTNEERIIFQLHSPLDLSIKTSIGTVSSSTEGIPNSVYRRFGELQYISLPSDEMNVINLHLIGQASGSFTLDIVQVVGDMIEEEYIFSAIPSSTSTVVTANVNNLKDLILKVDYDGDGITDGEYNEQGLISSEATYDELINEVKSLNISEKNKKVLLQLVVAAEKSSLFSARSPLLRYLERKALTAIKVLVQTYERKKIISKDEAKSMLLIIDQLINKI